MSHDPATELGPNPGSEEALALGCICAIMDNNHGRRSPAPPDGWWITEGCPVHAPVTLNVDGRFPGWASGDSE